MVLALCFMAFGLYLGLGFAGVMFWDAVRERDPLARFAAWSLFAAGAWALCFVLFVTGQAKVWALAAPVAGPLFVAWGYVRWGLRGSVRPPLNAQSAYRPNSPSRVADGD